MHTQTDSTVDLVRRAAAGETRGWSNLIGRYRNQLQRMVAVRLDRRIQCRLNASDVVQEVCLEAVDHLAGYVRDPRMPFRAWLRGITTNKLLELHRNHLGAQKRNAAREVRMEGRQGSSASSAGSAELLPAKHTGPSEAAIRAELKGCLDNALDKLEPVDREILELRHFEQLSNVEASARLNIDQAAASKRYVRALERLKKMLGSGDDCRRN
jgi:RNA polymerase sigma-70 factor (ECF subfamily)